MNQQHIFPSTTIDQLFDHGIISKRTENVCRTAGLITADDISRYRAHSSFRNLRNCGVKSETELLQMLAMVIDEIYIEEEPEEVVEEEEVLTAEEVNYLTDKFHQLLQKAERRTQTYITSRFRTIDELIPYLDYDLEKFEKFMGNKKKSALDFYNVVLLPMRQIYNSLKDSDNALTIRRHNAEMLFPFLTAGEVEEVLAFRDEHGHYPMYRLMEQKLARSEDKISDIVCARLGLGNYELPMTKAEIAGKHNLTVERVRQILAKPLPIEGLENPVLWEAYQSRAEELITPLTDMYQRVEEEKLSLSFRTFGIMTARVLPYEYVNDYGTEFLAKRELAEQTRTIINTLQALMRETHDGDEPVAVWEIFPQAEMHDYVLQHVCRLLNLEVDGDRIVFAQNNINVADEAYRILEAHGEPMHVDDIYEQFKAKYPDKKLTLPSFKLYLWNHEGIAPIGKTSHYALRKWDSIYTGNIRDLLREILNERDEPVSLDELTERVVANFPSTNRKNIHASLFNSDEFIFFENSLWGIRAKSYSAEYTPYDVSQVRLPFEERFKEYCEFVVLNQRFPYSGGDEHEETLCRWRANVNKGNIEATAEQLAALERFVISYPELPQNGYEVNFKQICQEYLEYYQTHGKHPTYTADARLNRWYCKNRQQYLTYGDNRTKYFQNLLASLAESRTGSLF